MTSGMSLIVGSEGFVGRELVRRFIERGIDFYSVDQIENLRANHFVASLNSTNLMNLINDLKPKTIIHLAAQTDVRRSSQDPISDFETNALGTLNLLCRVLEANCTNFIYINSGGAIYSPNSEIPFSENSLVQPMSPYGLSKYVGEEYVRLLCEQSRINWSSIALSNVYGPVRENEKGLFFEAWKAISSEEEFTIFGPEVTRDYIHVSDVCAAIMVAMKTPSKSRVNIGTGVETTNLDAYHLLENHMGKKTKVTYLPPRTGEVLRSALNIDKAKKVWGWQPIVDLEEGIRTILADSK